MDVPTGATKDVRVHVVQHFAHSIHVLSGVVADIKTHGHFVLCNDLSKAHLVGT